MADDQPSDPQPSYEQRFARRLQQEHDEFHNDPVRMTIRLLGAKRRRHRTFARTRRPGGGRAKIESGGADARVFANLQ
jgi:hypothetical protein